MGQGDIHMSSVTSSSSVKVSLTHALAATSQTTVWSVEDASKKPTFFFKDLEQSAKGRKTPTQTSDILRKARGRAVRERNPVTVKAVQTATTEHMLAEGWSADVFSVVMAMPYTALNVTIRQDQDGNPICGSDIIARLFNPSSMGELKSRLGW